MLKLYADRFAQKHGLSESARDDLLQILLQIAPRSATASTLDIEAPQSTAAEPLLLSAAAELGPYRLIKELGRGGMGSVYQVFDPKLNRSVALKIAEHAPPRSARRSRFVAEAQTTAQLQHPGILPVHEWGQLPDGRTYYTMEEIRGQTLEELIRAAHRAGMPPAALRRLMGIFLRVCEAVAYAHQRGVLHRDLKPSNVMVGEFGTVRVIDWGLAKSVGASEPSREGAPAPVETLRSSEQAGGTLVGSVVGTPGFMSPEQARGEVTELDPRSDIYSLGAILYYTLTGALPPAINAAATLDLYTLSALQDGSEDTADPGSLDLLSPLFPELSGRDPLPAALVEAAIKAMRYAREDRHPDVLSLARAVESWLEGADRMEKAQTEVARSGEVAREAEALRDKAGLSWEEAERLLGVAGTSSEEGWARWEEARALQHRAALKELDAEQLLYGALLYAPEMEEAHRRLAGHQRELRDRALSRGDAQAAELAERRLRAHQERLPPGERGGEEARPDSVEALRARRSALIGRVGLRARLRDLLRGGTRLATLLGPAGVGKTRLALEVAAERRQESGQEALLCDLTQSRDLAGIAQLAGQALGVPLHQQDPIHQLGIALRGRGRLLLVLDNLEHVAASAASALQRWLALAPELQVLATSRIRLGLPEEHRVAVEPLSLLEAIELFVFRGREARPDFALTPANRTLIGELVERLDCLPLAVELAAARLGMLSLPELSRRLTDRLALLRSRLRDPEQRALESALEWSWELLEPASKAALSQSSVFSGGFTLKAAEAVLDLGGEAATLDVLEALCDDHLVRRLPDAKGEVRYTLFESIRLFGREKLAAEEAVVALSGEALSGAGAARAARARHAAFFSELGADEMFFSGDPLLHERRAQELGNLLCAAEEGGEAGGRCCLAALDVLEMRGPFSRGVELAREALERDTSPGLRARLLNKQGWLLQLSGKLEESRTCLKAALDLFQSLGEDFGRGQAQLYLGTLALRQSRLEEAHSSYQEALSCFRRASSLPGEGAVLSNLGIAHFYQGRVAEALDYYRRALQIHRAFGNRRLEGAVLISIGNLQREQGLPGEALKSYQSALSIYESVGNRLATGVTLGNIGVLHKLSGRPEEALQQYQRALQIHQEVGSLHDKALTLSNLCNLHAGMGDLDAAMRCGTEALAIQRELGNRQGTARSLNHLSALQLQLDQPGAAHALQQEALQIFQEIGDQKGEANCLLRLAATHLRRGRADLAGAALERAEALLRQLNDPVELCKTICQRAVLCAQQGEQALAAQLFSEARGLFDATELGPESEPAQELRKVEALLALPATAPPPQP